MKRWTTAIALAACLGTASAQDIPPTEPVPPAPETGARVAPLPNWSIRKEVNNLDSSMREYNALTKSLSRASKELGDEFQKYLKNPNDEVLASSVEKKMALYAKQVMADFDDIISDQDLLGANFRDLQRKLVTFSDHLKLQADGFNLKLSGYKTKAKAIEKKLVELSVRIKENPPEDPAELRKLKREFARQFRAYRLQTRYVNGYQRRFQNYRTLGKNLYGLSGLFVNLHEKFNELIENLTNERQYLRDSLRLQADTLRIKQIIRDGILGSERAIGNVAEKLADLYTKVDAFTKVHERINTDMTKFVESQEILMDVTRKIDNIGLEGAPIGDFAQDVDKAIQAFYDKGVSGDDDEMLGVEKTEDEDAAEEDNQ